MEVDNTRDRFAHGFDAGQIIDGEVQTDPLTGSVWIVNDEGVGFDVMAALESLKGQTVRLTLVTLEAILNMESMLNKSAHPGPNSDASTDRIDASVALT